MYVGRRRMWPHPKGMGKEEGRRNGAEVGRRGLQRFVGMEWHDEEIDVAQMEGADHFGMEAVGDIGRGRRPKNLQKWKEFLVFKIKIKCGIRPNHI